MTRRFLFLLTVALSYAFLTACGGGSHPTQPQVVAVSVVVSPSRVTVSVGMTAQFTAAVKGTSNQAVTWEVNGTSGGNTTIGTISTSGLYTAPPGVPSPSTVTVTAVSQADPTKSGSATVTISGSSPSTNQALQNPPIKLGTSGGNANDHSTNFCCSGTLGALVSRNGTQFILSNNHVLARSDLAKAGEPIDQPGLVDNSCSPAQLVANLTQFVNLEATKISAGPPPVYSAPADAAIAQVVSGQVDPTGAILQLGTVSGGVPQPAPPASTTITPTVGMQVAKSGRTTGLTCASIGTINLTVDVDYNPSCGSKTVSFTVRYSNQIDIASSTFSNAGDSGSLVVNAQTAQPIGLLYGGGPSDTVAHPIQAVLNALPDPNNKAVPTIVGGATHTVAGCTGGAAAASTQATTMLMRIPDNEISRATAAKDNHLSTLMSDPAVIGVGVTAGDVPGTAGVMIFVEQGKGHAPIPAQLDGIPVKVRAVPRFRAFNQSCSASAADMSLPTQSDFTLPRRLRCASGEYGDSCQTGVPSPPGCTGRKTTQHSPGFVD